jgi:hypothetical protein
MKVYSDKLTEQDLRVTLSTAVNTYVPGHCGFEKFEHLARPRLASRGWDVLLYRAGSRRPFATGRHGAGDRGAARYDDYGLWLAALYDLDPDMQVRGQYPYKGRDDFHRATEGKFRAVTA